MKYVFFGTGEIAVGVLDELEMVRLMPALIVTAPDKPSGRGKKLTPPPVKQWALMRSIEILQPEKLDTEFCYTLQAASYKLFVVADFGTFLPKTLLAIPERGVINMHPSLLPRLRGPSPIRSAILNDEKETGVSLMLVDEQMDHGPIIAQRKVTIPDWPPRGRDLDRLLASAGGKLLAEILPLWARGEIEAHEQNHDIATYSNLFKKEDGLLDLQNGDPYQNLLKINAFDGWPGTYAFFEKGGPSTRSTDSGSPRGIRGATSSGQAKKIRVQILEAHLEHSELVIDIVKPEGKREMPYKDFVRSP